MNEETCCPNNEIKSDPIFTVGSEEAFYADKEINANARLDICKTCPELFTLTNTCKQCGCFMSIKTRIYSASCPLGKW
jgi:hypothetical protein